MYLFTDEYKLILVELGSLIQETMSGRRCCRQQAPLFEKNKCQSWGLFLARATPWSFYLEIILETLR